MRPLGRDPHRLKKSNPPLWWETKVHWESLDEITDHTHVPALVTKLKAVFAAASTTFEVLRTAENSLIDFSNAVSTVRGEEGELYWWVLRHRSQPGDDRADVKLALHLARELTDLTTFGVEHPSARAFLRHALRDPTAKISIKEVVAEPQGSGSKS